MVWMEIPRANASPAAGSWLTGSFGTYPSGHYLSNPMPSLDSKTQRPDPLEDTLEILLLRHLADALTVAGEARRRLAHILEIDYLSSKEQPEIERLTALIIEARNLPPDEARERLREKLGCGIRHREGKRQCLT